MSDRDPDKPAPLGTRVLSALRQAAERGHAEAQFQLGMLYASGEQLPLDYVTAAKWISAAAEQGWVAAQSTLAWLYASGYGVEQSDQLAAQWYLRAGESGNPNAQYMVATLYRYGRYGMPRDPGEMLEWYQRAAARGHASAQLALGRLLIDGKDVEKDDVVAFQWLSLAAVNGSQAAARRLEQLMQTMSPIDIAKAKGQMRGNCPQETPED